VQEGFGVRQRPGTLVEHRGLTSMLVPGGVVFTRPGRCNVPSGAALPAPSYVIWGFSRPARFLLRELWLLPADPLSQRSPSLASSQVPEAHGSNIFDHRQPWSTSVRHG
jgi:hypothetical protein